MNKGFLFIGLAALLFSTMEVALKLLSLGFNPLQLNFLRFSIGAIVLLPFALASLRKRAALRAGDYAFFALAGFVCVCVSMTLYQIAVTRTPAAVVAVIFSCNPVFVLPLASWILGEKVGRKTFMALAASLSGIACIAAPAFTRPGSLDILGLALTVLSSLVFAFYGVLGKARSARYGGLAMTCLSFIAGALVLLALMGLSHIAPVAEALSAAGLSVFAAVPVFRGLGPSTLPGLLYLGIIVTGLGYAFWFLGMEATSAQTGSVVFFIKPALAPLLAFLALGESLSPLMVFGIALILLGSGLLMVSPKPRRSA